MKIHTFEGVGLKPASVSENTTFFDENIYLMQASILKMVDTLR